MSTDTPRVLCLMQLPPPLHGASTINATIAGSQELASSFRLEVIPLRFASSIEDLGRPSIRKLVTAITILGKLIGSIHRERPDVVYFTLTPRPGAFYRDCVFAAVVKMHRIPLVYHLHSQGVAAHLSDNWKRKLCAWVFKGAWVIHLSPELAQDLGGLVSPERLLFVENGIEDRCDVSASRPMNEPPRILFVAHMREDKGPLVLLEALRVLQQRGVPFMATFAGAEGTRSCVRAFEDYVERNDLSSRVRWVGPVFGTAKDELFRTHDVFAYPTQNDAFPLVVLEAMQWGLPVVATMEGAIPAMLGRLGGVVVAKGDAIALADELHRLLMDGAENKRMGGLARSRYFERFTKEHFIRRWASAMRTIIDASRTKKRDVAGCRNQRVSVRI